MVANPRRTEDGTEVSAFADQLSAVAEELAATMQPGAMSGDSTASRKGAGSPALDLELVMRIPVTMKVVLGSTTLPVSDLTRLQRGDLVPLDRKVGDPVDIVVNGRVVARGQIVIVDERTSQFGVTLTDVGDMPSGGY
jgi:flagellar motor switch protein FliN/FliY